MFFTHQKKIILAIIGIVNLIFYLVYRISYFCISKLNIFESLYSIIFFLCELVLLLNTFGLFLVVINVSKHQIKKSDNQKNNAELINHNYPSVAIIVAARHEPLEILENTFTTLKNLKYPNKTIYFLDDSSDENFKKEAKEISIKYSLKLFSREIRHGAKAGIINDFLKTAKEKYIAVFDADQNPMPNFLIETVSILEKRENVAFVQTPQFYTNLNISPVANGSGMQQAIFYELICEGKGYNNSMFCCGTNFVFRKDAFLKIGGFDEDSITEDFSTSLELHRYGYESYYYNHVGVFGMAPETLLNYFKQQIRWATGTINTFKKLLKVVFTGIKKLSFIQLWEYFLSSTYYFIGWVIFVFMLLPIINLIFNIGPFMGNSYYYLGTFLPYFIISMFLFFLSMKARNYSFLQIYQGIILTYLCFPIFMISAIYGLFVKKMKFIITTKGKYVKLPFKMLLPYLAMILLSLIGIVTGINNFLKQNDYVILINLFWVVYHLFILLNIFYFNREIKIKK